MRDLDLPLFLSPAPRDKKHLARMAFTSSVKRSTITSMKRLHGDPRPALRSALKRLERVAASVLLVIGAAALIGWVVVELYVKVVTAD